MPPGEIQSGRVIWSDDGAPRSVAFGDVYFSLEDGLAETRTVFLTGCGLPEAWRGRRRFTVGELGFGTGLNIAALLELWRTQRPVGGVLHVFSIEASPLSREDAARALGGWPELAEVAGLLLDRWPPLARGFHRIELPELGAILDLAVMDAAEALQAWNGKADAWFLDGFAPSANPGMWSEAVMAGLARCCAPGARLATYSVAGIVRRGLAAAGFEIARQPGHGRKRERLEACLPGPVARERPAPRVAIIGAGIAGAALARAFGALGLPAQVFERERPGAGASGAPAGMMAPRLDAGLGPAAALFAQAARRAGALYDSVEGAVLARGVTQLAGSERDVERFDRIAAADLFAPQAMTRVSADQLERQLTAPGTEALVMADGRVVRAGQVLRAWLPTPRPAAVARVVREAPHWSLRDAEDRELVQADIVVVAAGLASGDLIAELDLRAVRGQATLCQAPSPPALLFGGYVIPTREGFLFGATHDRDDSGTDIREADRLRNLETLASRLPGLAAQAANHPMDDWAGVRAATADYMPLAGPVAAGPGLFVLTGLGSRGLCLSPLLAEHVAALALDAPSPLPREIAALVDPARFARRAARRAGLR